MTTGRRALAATAVRMNNLERYLFAIGGDDGTATPTALQSVEAARVDALGRVEAWSPQANSLPAARSHATAAVVGRFVYLPGGRVAGAPTTEVLRAYLLDPFEAAEITDLDLQIDADLHSGLGGGTWYYRVAAVLDTDDLNNPGGEALAGEPTVVRLPASNRALRLTLNWAAVPNAASYRLYRSPDPDLTSGSERLMAEIPAVAGTVQTYVDDGQVTVDPAGPQPLPVGSLGTWHTVLAEDGTTLQLATAREGAGVVAVPNPADPSKAFLYVLGGRSGPTTGLTCIEYAVVTTTDTNAQTISAFSTSASSLGTARWLMGAVYLDAGRATSLLGTTDAYVYALPGSAADRETTKFGETDAFMVNLTDGTLGARTTVASTNSAGGYGYAAGSNYLYVFGGGGNPTQGGVSSLVGVAPALGGWNSGINQRVARYLHASASESGFVFLLGGVTIGGTSALVSTESTNF